jgi:transposase-like protein
MARRRSTERELHWRALIRRQAASGLSISAFCRQEDVSEGSFFNWRRKLAGRSGDSEAPTEADFVAIELPEHSPAIGQHSIEVVLPDGCRVILPPDSNGDLLRDVLDAVRERSC